MDWSEDAAKNRDVWTKGSAEYTDARADVAWAKDAIDWGIWDHPESDVDVLGDVDGLDIVELGCGTDLVLSEYGASFWVDPYRWIPEAARKAPLVGADLRSAGSAGAPSAPLTPNDRNV